MVENVHVPESCSEKELRVVEVVDHRNGVDARRAEVRSMLVRLLVKLYTERHQEPVKEAA